jgi:hypothetical protein
MSFWKALFFGLHAVPKAGFLPIDCLKLADYFRSDHRESRSEIG